MAQTTTVLTKVARYRDGLSIECKSHGTHTNWKCYANNVVCTFCMRERAKRYHDRNYLKYLALYAKRRDPNSEITEEFLEELAESQNHQCALSGIFFDDGHKPSVDRIDSNLGYLRSNVQLTLLEINKMKSDLSLANFIELCIRVALTAEKK